MEEPCVEPTAVVKSLVNEGHTDTREGAEVTDVSQRRRSTSAMYMHGARGRRKRDSQSRWSSNDDPDEYDADVEND